jgi:hypothetical protein
MAAPLSRRHLTSDLPLAVLRADGVVVAAGGLVLLAGAAPLAEFFGAGGWTLYAALGILFIVYGVSLVWHTLRRPVEPALLLAIALLNTVWVLASVVMLLLDTPDVSSGGRWVIALAAVVVAGFAAVQFAAWRGMR